MPEERGGGADDALPLLRRRTATETVGPAARSTALLDDDVRDTLDDVQRRAGDEQLRAHLAATGFQGPEYDRFVRRLAAYGIGVCLAKVRSGAIFHDCAAVDRPLEPPPADWSESEMRGLVHETVARALISFREQGLVGGGWKPDGRASLATYFIGACVLGFANVYRPWAAERRRWRRMAEAFASRRAAAGPTDPAEIVSVRDRLRSGLRNLDPRTREAIVLTELGYEQDEIADLMSVSTRAVEGLLYRHRARLAAAEIQGGEQ